MLRCCFQRGKIFEAGVIAGTVPDTRGSAGAASVQPAVAALAASMTLAASAAMAEAGFHPRLWMAGAAGRWLGCHRHRCWR